MIHPLHACNYMVGNGYFMLIYSFVPYIMCCALLCHLRSPQEKTFSSFTHFFLFPLLPMGAWTNWWLFRKEYFFYGKLYKYKYSRYIIQKFSSPFVLAWTLYLLLPCEIAKALTLLNYWNLVPLRKTLFSIKYNHI